MKKGFCVNSELSTKEVIANLQGTRKLLRNNFTQKRDTFRAAWLKTWQDRDYAKVPEHNLYSPYEQHSCLKAQTPDKHSCIGRHNDKLLFFANSDFWTISVTQQNGKNKLSAVCQYDNVFIPKLRKCIEFQFSVKVGPYRFFIPSLIKKRICNWYGEKAYETWRELVKADLPNLKPYLSAYNPTENLHSVVAEDSSAGVCQSMGLPVKHGIAYWLKQKQTDYRPQIIPDVVDGTALSGLSDLKYLTHIADPELTRIERFNAAVNGSFQRILQTA